MESETSSFESAYERLESIVRELEADGMSIDRAVDLYEDGVRLVRLCNARLDRAEMRISRLASTDGGGFEVVPLDVRG